jgi:probable rRNA maturation factor
MKIDLPMVRRELRALIRKTPAGLRRRAPGDWVVEAHLVTGPAMARLNGQYRGKPYATDVLSFDAPAVFRRQGHLGELVICGAVLRRQAREQGHSPARELRVLLVHGLLHLLGFDHERGPRAAREMARWEARWLAGVGLVGRGPNPTLAYTRARVGVRLKPTKRRI